MSFFNHGILGINARNLLYIKPYNPKIAVNLADDKIKTKQFLQARGIPVPKLLARIKNIPELEKFDWDSLPDNFVLKPNSGFGGEGIVVIQKRIGQNFGRVDGEMMTIFDLESHIESILSGRFAITNTFDQAFFEQRLIPHDFFKNFTEVGLPDIRIVVHNLIPVMAMMRVPSAQSEGKANLHLGAFGIGIDISKGETTHAVRYNKIVSEIPGHGLIKGYKIPFWDDILLIASKLQQITNLGYLACDIVLDKNQGPILLEINARAGLMVQIANLAPLRKRLERIKGIKVNSPEKGVRIGQDLFGQKIEKDIKNISGKEIIGHRDHIELHLAQGGNKTILARIRPDLDKSYFSKSLVEELKKIGELQKSAQENFKVKFNLGGKKIQTVVGVMNMEDKDYSVIVGRRELKDFLIDPLKEYVPTAVKKKDIDLKSVDKRICDIDSKLKILYNLRPDNLDEELHKFEENNQYNPRFVYPELDFDPEDLLDRLKYIETDSSPLGQLFENKKTELKLKINLLQKRGEAEEFTQTSLKLFAKPNLRIVRLARQQMKYFAKNSEDQTSSKLLTAFDVKENFEKVFEKYGLTTWKVILKDNMVVDCSAGKNGFLFLKKEAQFTKHKIEELIRHEIETHILTAANGALQPYNIFQRGTANYLIAQEGLAVYNQTHFSEQKNEPKGWGVLGVHAALENNFSQTYQTLIEFGVPDDIALRTTVKVKRGLTDTRQKGAFTKESIYLSGYKKLEEYLKAGGKIASLYLGKINFSDVPLLEKTEFIKPPKYLPDYWKNEAQA